MRYTDLPTFRETEYYKITQHLKYLKRNATKHFYEALNNRTPEDWVRISKDDIERKQLGDAGNVGGSNEIN